MKKLLIILSMLLLTACARFPETASAPEMKGNTPPEVSLDKSLALDAVLNFRTSDSMEMKSENLIIKTYAEFEAYLAEYAVLDNPFFIDEKSLSALKKIDEATFEKDGLIVVILVESSGSNSVLGENLVIKGNVAEAFINRREAQIGTADIATRHVVYVVSQEELKEVTEVKVTLSLK